MGRRGTTQVLPSASKGSPSSFLLRSTRNKAVISSNTALETSDPQLSNAGSTIKIAHFLDDMNPSEIKVSEEEISENLKKVKICINEIQFSKAHQRK